MPLTAGANEDGAHPQAPLVYGPDGNLYGLSAEGGPNLTGTVFKLTPDGQFSILYLFSALSTGGRNADGANPRGALMLSKNGHFYGITTGGGQYGSGTVFRLDLDGTLTTLHHFTGVIGLDSSEGAYPVSGLVEGDDGCFYGATQYGGLGGSGSLYRITPEGIVTTLHSFAPYTEGLPNDDGAWPQSRMVIGPDGGFYGSAQFGGSGDSGTLFRLGADGSFNVLYSFSVTHSTRRALHVNDEGAQPIAPLVVGSDGNLYGATAVGGLSGTGTLFRLSPQGELTLLHTFAPFSRYAFLSRGGQIPIGGLIEFAPGLLYGSTTEGGAGSSGTVFSLGFDGSFNIVYSFSATDAYFSNSDGAYPESTLLPGIDGRLYATTFYGGVGGSGVIYALTP